MIKGFKKFTGPLLEMGRITVGLELGNDLLINGFDLIIKFLSFVGRIPQTPGAGEIVEIAAALFAGENIKDNGLPQLKWI